MRAQHERLKEEHEKTKQQYQLILTHLVESKRGFKNLNEAYERKCE